MCTETASWLRRTKPLLERRLGAVPSGVFLFWDGFAHNVELSAVLGGAGFFPASSVFFKAESRVGAKDACTCIPDSPRKTAALVPTTAPGFGLETLASAHLGNRCCLYQVL